MEVLSNNEGEYSSVKDTTQLICDLHLLLTLVLPLALALSHTLSLALVVRDGRPGCSRIWTPQSEQRNFDVLLWFATAVMMVSGEPLV